MSFLIRAATIDDLHAIQAIYNAEIQHGYATWNDKFYELTHYIQWFHALQAKHYPLIVIENTVTQDIAGYAEYSAFRTITGYKQTVEHSVYIAPAFARQGLGQQLLQYLIDHAAKHHIHVMVAAIDHDNTASIALHQKLGFKQTGYMPQVGQKFGQWRDLVLMQLNFENTQIQA